MKIKNKILIKLFLIALMTPLSVSAKWGKPVDLSEYALQVELAQNQDGTMVAFFIDMSREIHYMTQASPGSNQWSKAKSLDTYGNYIKVGKNADGRLVLFNIGTLGNMVYQITQAEVNSDKWLKEYEFDGLYATQLEVANNADGSLSLFALQMDREVAIVRQDAANIDIWRKKRNMDVYANQISVTGAADGRLMLFNIGTVGNVLYQLSQTSPNSKEWSKETEIKDFYARQIKAVPQQNGLVSLFFIDMGTEVNYLTQSAANSNVFNNTATGINASWINVAADDSGKLTLAAIATMANALSYSQQVSINSNEWSKEVYLDGYGKQIALGKNKQGHLQLMYIAALANELHSVAAASK